MKTDKTKWDELNLYQGCAGEIRPFDIQKFDFSKGYVIEEKFDGIWVNIDFNSKGKVTLISRTMKVKDNKQLSSLIEYIEKTFQLTDTNLIGELAFGSQRGTEFAEKHGHHKVDVFDVLRYKGEVISYKPIVDRKAVLRELFHFKKPDETWVRLEMGELLRNPRDVQKAYDKVVKAGGEGLIVKDRDDNIYRFGSKSPVWYKIKKMVSMDYVIMGYEETDSDTFRDKGWIGGIKCGLYVDGKMLKKVTVGSMDYETRDLLSKNQNKFLGAVVEIGGFEIFKSGSMRHPFFMRFRDDKDRKECVWEK